MAVGDVRALPKGHLHYHLEPCMRPGTLDALCAKYGVDRAADPLMNVPRNYPTFDDFQDAVVSVCFNTIREREDVTRIVMEMAEDAAQQGVCYLEPAFGMSTLLAERWGAPERSVWDVLFSAGKAAQDRHGLLVRWMVPAVRTWNPQLAERTARLSAEMAAAGEPVVSFGLHASEGATLDGKGPFPPGPFAEAFRIAAGAGLISTPHAGEFLGPESCRAAVEELRADRLQHGVRACEDPATLDLLRDRRVCCDVCPTSNVLLNVVPSLERHPLPTLINAGVPCTINVDDSLLFGPSIVDEYQAARGTLGLSDAQLRGCARHSLTYSGLMLRAQRGFADGEGVAFLESKLDAIEAWGLEGDR